MKFNLKKQTLAAVAIFTMALALSACGSKTESTYSDSSAQQAGAEQQAAEEPSTEEKQQPEEKQQSEEESKTADTDMGIDLDKLNNAADAIKNLDINTDVSINGGSGGSAASDKTENAPAKEDKPAAGEPKGEKTVYSYTDVYRSGNSITVIANGGLNGSTELYGSKDLNGFLDYVDSNVLEEGRKINRDFFYDILSIMLVDKDLSSDFDRVEKHLIMALAMANNFHAMDVRVNDCYLDANSAADYHYNVTAYGKDDKWIANYENRTLYMNDGKTEYVSDMFKDEYLAVWLMAIDDYYGTK